MKKHERAKNETPSKIKYNHLIMNILIGIIDIFIIRR